MTETPPAPQPRKSRRMILWMVVAPVVVLLLAFGGANWKVFHLIYAKHLMRKDDIQSREKGLQMVLKTHLQTGMTREEVSRLLYPVKLQSLNSRSRDYYVQDADAAQKIRFFYIFDFDNEDRLEQRPVPFRTFRRQQER